MSAPETPNGDDLAALLVEQLGAVELADGAPDDTAPCRWPSHRANDRRNQAGRLVCGVCHPPTARIGDLPYPDALSGDPEAGDA